jgi:L-ascorbate metabolism protein UlaG (beta-lactamase superfamily)
MKIKILVFCFIISSVSLLFPQSKSKELRITYIANEGFLLSTTNKKVMVDALFTDGYGFFMVPSKGVTDSIENAMPPFENIDLYLLTHYHNDHLDPKLLMNYLEKHKNVPLVCSGPSINFIKGKSELAAQLSSQIIEETPPTNQNVTKEINGIRLKIFSLKHLSFYKNGVDIDSGMHNLSFLFEMDGIKIFHSGDIMKNALDGFINQNKDWTDSIDVAFLYYQLLDSVESDPDFVIKMLNPKYIVLMHIPPSQIADWTMKIEQLKIKYPNITCYVNTMDTQTILTK